MRNKKSKIIAFLCVALIFMGIGYAALQTNLNITGTSKASGTFDVKITNVEVDQNNTTSGATDTMDPIGENYAVTETTLSATFNAPGDYITYDITVTNRGSIDAVIAVEANPQVDDDSYFDMSCNAVNGTEIAAGGTTSFQCVMTFRDDPNMTSMENITDGVLQVAIVAQQKSTSVAPSVVCYHALDEAKSLGVINGSNKTSISTYGLSNVQEGDLLGFGTSDIDSNEQFYVIEKNGNTLKLLSRYLINVGLHQKPWDNCSRDTRGIQDENIGFTASRDMEDMMAEFEQGYLNGTLPFSSTNYWWDSTNSDYLSPYSQNSFVYGASSALKTYVDSYVSTLNTLGLSATNGTILSIQDLGGICNNRDFTVSVTDTSGCPSYVFETTYWLGSAGDDDDDVWDVSAYGNFGDDDFDFDTNVGVRPVITVSLS